MMKSFNSNDDVKNMLHAAINHVVYLPPEVCYLQEHLEKMNVYLIWWIATVPKIMFLSLKILSAEDTLHEFA